MSISKEAQAHISNQPCIFCRDRIEEEYVEWCVRNDKHLPNKCKVCKCRMNGTGTYQKMPPYAKEFDYYFAKHEEGIRKYMAENGRHCELLSDVAKELWDTGLPFYLASVKKV